MAKPRDTGDTPAMARKKKAAPGAARRTGKPPRRILVLDVGGSHVKLRVGERGTPRKFVSGPQMTPALMVKGVLKRVSPADYNAM